MIGRKRGSDTVVTRTRRSRPTREEFLADVERGVLDDRFDAFMPLDQYDPPTKAERPPARRAAGRAHKDQVNGQAAHAATRQ
jgi:hypothetical protein